MLPTPPPLFVVVFFLEIYSPTLVGAHGSDFMDITVLYNTKILWLCTAKKAVRNRQT